MTDLKVVFMGTPDFALPSLKMLATEYNVVGVFCQPDKINGRGNKVTFGPVKEYSIDNSIPVYQPTTFKDNSCLDIIHSLTPDIIVVAAYGKILPNYVLEYPKYGCINVHGSLLPKYRGASPIQSAVMNGDKKTGITIMHMAEQLDAGDIILSEETCIGEYETAGELFDRLSELGAVCLKKAIESIVDGTATRTPQDHSLSSHVTMFTKDMGLIDFSQSSSQIKSKVYALNPWPSAYIESTFGLLKIHRVIIGEATTSSAGTILSVSKKGIEVACGDGVSVFITEIQKQGKRKMDAYSFSLGCKLPIGKSISEI